MMIPERKRLVYESWQRLTPLHGRIADAFYSRLFEMDQHARELFASTDMTEQKAKVVGDADDIVRNLDHMDGLFPIVVGLGGAGIGATASRSATTIESVTRSSVR